MQQASVQENDYKRVNNLGGNDMFKKMKKHVKNEKGLTLIELLAVVVILGIISAIAVPAIGNIIQNSRDKAILSEGVNILSAAKLAYTDGKCDVSSPASGAATAECDSTDINGYLDGVELGGTDQPTATANLTAAGTWTLTYSRWTDIKGNDYKVSGAATEADITSKLNK
ncbi:type IV pilus assembly protein PilA [Ureibacillus xyleni]|uniref:Type IV pilus assembly protein PilA n=1 Tax=Ureibacillus xyleni TaxID=614648 RepID=A0A285RIM5_9BACL|nr:type IV pilus assembly protein PilA [Ureibacillus xyleni]